MSSSKPKLDLSDKKRRLYDLLLREAGVESSPTSGRISRRTGTTFPMSFAQERLWFLAQLEPENAFYNEPKAVRMRGPLNLDALEETLREVVSRHATLRTRFATIDGAPVQSITPPPHDIRFTIVDYRDKPEAEREALLRADCTEEARRPFDLATGPLMRARLFRLADDDHVILLTMHHIVSDGWSMGVLVREVGLLYDAFCRGAQSPLSPLRIQYTDYAAWQREWLRGDVVEQQLSYWRRTLAELPPVLPLPTDRPRPPVQTYAGGRRAFDLGPTLVREVLAFNQREDVTTFMTLFAAFVALLHRYTGMTDIVVGTPVANRTRAETEGLIGFFVNTLVLRVDASGDPTFRELVGRVKEAALGAYAHQDLPFERLVEKLHPERDLGKTPLFQVMFILQNAPLPPLELGGVKLALMEVDGNTSKFDLTLDVQETERGLFPAWEYSTELFDPATIERMTGHLRALLTAALARPDTRLSETSLLTSAERRQLAEWNATEHAYGETRLVHEIIRDQATATPDAIAVEIDGETLTYRALDERASALARELCARGVAPEQRVALLFERSLELVVAIVAVLKAGGAYVPIEPDLPAGRLERLLTDASPRVLLTHRALASKLERCPVPALDLDTASQVFEASSAETRMPPALATEQTAAYVIYTSGSTGAPKGVINVHAGLRNRLLWMQQAYSLGPGDRVLQKTPYAFDVSVWEFLWPLMFGATIVLARPGGHKEPAYLADLVATSCITVTHFVPSMLQAFVEQEAVAHAGALRHVVCSGEALPRATAERFAARARARLHNLYGPTEASIDVTSWEYPREGARLIPIGRPIANLRVHVRDRSLRQAPIGVPGELYLAGVGLARGYLGRPDLTAERFVPDPDGAAGGERAYRTGDSARFMADGNVDFIGRLDFQIKLRGFRIELGEIEAAATAHAAVQESVVVVSRAGSQDPRLVAYIVPSRAAATVSARGAVTEQIAQWKDVFDGMYREGANAADSTFDIVGWNSSYTGEPLPAEEMRTWVESTVERIRELDGHRVLEIGCGTGLLLHRIASEPRCERYVGTDFSPSVLERLRARLDQRGIRNVELVHAEANRFERLDRGAFDVVVLNSIVQYFPSAAYLVDVLRGALDRVQERGFVFIGDLRSLPLLNALHASVQLHRAADGTPTDRLRDRIRRRVSEENELLVDPALFEALRASDPRIARVDVLLKRGRFQNELTKFRYDVVLHVGEAPAGGDGAADLKVNWRRDQMTLEALHRLIVAKSPGRLSIRSVPNARVERDVRLVRAIRDGEARTARELRDLLNDGPRAGIEPEDVWQLATTLGYRAIVTFSGAPEEFDAELWRADAPARTSPAAASEATSASPRVWTNFTNSPIQRAMHLELASQLKEWLHQRLPEYMVPSAYVLLDTLPRTATGKIDRKALPEPDARAVLQGAFVAPRSPIEASIAEMWAEVLRIDQVGAHDNFFDVGGHSLLGTQIMSRLRKTFGVDLPLRTIFEAPTVAQLSERVQAATSSTSAAAAPPIERVPRDGELPLSFSQERLWFLNELQPETATFNMPVAIRMLGDLDVAIFRRCTAEVVDRHEALRTTFANVRGRPVQVIRDDLNLDLPVLDFSGLPPDVQRERLRVEALLEAETAFDLARGPLFRAKLLRFSDSEHVVMFHTHHIVSDGWSRGVLIREVAALYGAYSRGDESPLAPLPFQYVDFAAWQRAWMHGEVLDAELAYWRTQLDGAPHVLELPTDHPRPPVQTFRGGRHTMILSQALTDKVHDFCRREGITPFMALFAVFAVFLERHTGQDDMLIGSPVANRTRADVEDLIGLFINTIVLRADLRGRPSFRELLDRVKEMALGAYSHQDLPIERLIAEMKVDRDMSRQPLFQVVFVVHNPPMPPLELPRLRLALLGNQTERHLSDGDLTLDFWEVDSKLHGDWTYAADLLEPSTVLRWATEYTSLLERLLAAPELCIWDAPSLHRAAQEGETADPERLVVEWNETAADIARGTLLHERFEEHARSAPDSVAVLSGDAALTYGELDRRANQLAHHLRSLGVGAETRVGVCVERSIAMIAVILGVLKAGAAYVPLDAEHRDARVRLAVVLTTANQAGAFADLGAKIVCLDDAATADAIGRGPTSAMACLATGASLACILPTAGATGAPKSVAIEHRGMLNNAVDMNRRLSVGASDVVLATAPLRAGAAVHEILGALEAGARLIVADPDRDRRAADWLALVDTFGVTIASPPPARLATFAEAFHARRGDCGPLASLRVILLGGDWVSPSAVDAARAIAPAARCVAVGGATEASTYSTLFEVHDLPNRSRTVPYGRAMSNEAAYVLDDRLRPAPVGVMGELFFGGIGAARGYADGADRTAAAFIPNPYGAVGARIWQSGDLARCASDGTIELVGRVADQTELRRLRVDAGEVEAALREHASVRDAILVARTDAAPAPLVVAYVVPKAGATCAPRDLAAHLKARVPEYMIPGAFVVLDAFPLSDAGKVDRRALPLPAPSRGGPDAFAAPKNSVEQIVADVCAQVLGRDVGVNDNFFELGGHSLLAAQVVAQVKEVLDVDIPLRALFEAPSVARLADWLITTAKEAGTDLVAVADVVLEVSQLSDEAAHERLAELPDAEDVS